MFDLTPRLKTGTERKIGSIARRGVWVPQVETGLQKLSESIYIAVDGEIESLNGIPDMWARPLLFELALLDEHHLLHQRILGEWRGLLALVAFKEWKHLPLREERVAFPGNNQLKRGGDFISSLTKLLPRSTGLLSDSTTWRDISVIIFDDEPIGITSPTTIVCTAKEYHHMGRIEWYRNGGLQDPVPHLSTDEQKALCWWLMKLVRELRDIEGDEAQSGAVIKIINQYINDLLISLQANTNNPALTERNIPEGQLSEQSLSNKGLFALLTKPLLFWDPERQESELLLLGTRDNKKPRVIMVDTEIAAQWQMGTHQIRVFGPVNLASIGLRGFESGCDILGGHPVPEDFVIKKPADLFTDRIQLIKQKDAFEKDHTLRISGQNYFEEMTVIPPIKSWILEYFKAEDIAERLSFSMESGNIIVSMRFPLSGPDQNSRDFVFKKTYRKDKGEISDQYSSVPVFCIYPNFRILNDEGEDIFKTYYATYIPSRTGSFNVVPIDHAIAMKATKDVSIFGLSFFPEAAVVRGEIVESGTRRERDLGLILLKRPQGIKKLGNEWHIGIDFGTTSTNVWYREDNKTPLPMTFQDRYFQVTASGDQALLYDYLLPNGTIPAPFLSLLYDYLETDPGSTSYAGLKDCRVHYIRDLQQFNALKHNIIPNLKWSDKVENRSRLKAFLQQIMLQSAIEACAARASSVRFYCSYPPSLPNVAQFLDQWESALKNCRKLIPYDIGALEKKTESVATAHYFAFRLPVTTRALFESGMVSIDIGGGTSDISIYQSNDLKLQVSLKYAGRDIFLDVLHQKYRALLKMFCESKNCIDTLHEAVVNNSEKERFYAQADALIKDKGNTWLENITTYSGDPAFRAMQHILCLGLSGLFYYVGLLLRYLIENDKYDIRLPDIYVGGMGANILHWATGAEFGPESGTSSLFKQMILQASGIQGKESDFDITISQEPKCEAAYGLVCEQRTIGKSEDSDDRVVSGEDFLAGGKYVSWKECLKADICKRGIKFSSAGLNNSSAFLELFTVKGKENKLPIKDMNMSKLGGKIKKSIEDELSALRNRKKEEILVEPLFILAMKKLLQMEMTNSRDKDE